MNFQAAGSVLPALDITYCNINITDSNNRCRTTFAGAKSGMKLGEKLRYLRLVEGTLRGMGREMTQQDLARALEKELGRGLSQSYLSQIESGARPHLTNASRMMLARFFKVHPGYLVDDPEGYHTELTSDLRAMQDRLELWLIEGAEQFARDTEVSHALLQIARHQDTRKCLVLLGAILEAPQLMERLTDVLKPSSGAPSHRDGGGKKPVGSNL
jgi:transcriptional regulator with XRE-family HTH domain